MACGKKSNNAPTEEFILESPAPVDVAAKISAIYRELSEKVAVIQIFLYLIMHLESNHEMISFFSQEKDRAIDLREASRFSEEICNDLVGIGSSTESPGAITVLSCNI